MPYIVIIGTQYDAPPSPENPEQIIWGKIDKKYKTGYLFPSEFENFEIKNFYSRAAFIFPHKPSNLNSISYFEDDMNSVYPYQKVYDKIISNNKFNYASWWIVN